MGTLNELINENPDVNITIKAGDLMEFGQKIASQTAREILEKHDEKVYTRAEIIEKFHICSATLWRWDKLKLINSKKIGNRVYYSESEIMNLISMKGIKS